MRSQILVAALSLLSSANAAPAASVEARAVAGSPIGYGAGTTGGAGGTTTTVTTCDALIAAVNKKDTSKKVVYIDGLLTDCGIVDGKISPSSAYTT